MASSTQLRKAGLSDSRTSRMLVLCALCLLIPILQANAGYSGTLVSVAGATIPPGQDLTYTLTVQNTGSSFWFAVGSSRPAWVSQVRSADCSWTPAPAWTSTTGYHWTSVSGGANASDTATFPADSLPSAPGTYTFWVSAYYPTNSVGNFLLMSGSPMQVTFTISTPYTVTFDAQGGTTPNPTSKAVTYGSTYGTLATTTRTGYIFGGWWTSTGGTGTQITSGTTVTITSAQTLYAYWTPITSTVTFDAQGGTTPNPTSKIVTYASTYGTLATTTRAGYTFAGWWTSTGGTGTQITSATTVTITASQTLYANWTLLTTTHGTPYPWLDQYGLVAGGNYEAADALDTDGDGHTAWQEYVAGTVPTNRASVFKALVTMSNGLPGVAWTPDLGTGRVYTVEGRTNLTVGSWGTSNATSRYFRVKVALP